MRRVESLAGRNEIVVGEEVLLLVEAGACRTHLVRRIRGSHPGAQPAVDSPTMRSSLALAGGGAQNYDQEALLDPIWLPTTLCGVQWYLMAATDAGALTYWQEPTYAPDCKRCLRSASRGLVSTDVDVRVPLVAAVVAALVQQHGYAVIEDVPGDQTEHLRNVVRKCCKSLGLRCTTLVDTNGTIHASSRHLWEGLSDEERTGLLREALESRLDGGEVGDQPWRVSWRTWRTF